MANDNKLTIGLVVVVGLLALVAIIISAISLSKNTLPTITVNNPAPSGGASSGSQGQGSQGQGGQGQGGQRPVIVQLPASSGGGYNTSLGLLRRYKPAVGSANRIYTVYVGNDYGSHGYLDAAGYHTGFGVGLVDLVCGEAGIDCRIMWDRPTNCWDSNIGQHASGGKGLHGRWLAGCVGWYTTVERSHVFKFSQAYLKAPVANFIVLPGKSFEVSKDNILSSKIVFIDAWASDEKCLARQTGAVTQVPNIVYSKTTTQAINLLNNGYDAIFATRTSFGVQLDDGSLKTVGSDYSCMLAGLAVMARKDEDITEHWNRGFTKIKNNGRFKKYCEAANAEHAARGTVDCVDSF